MCNTDPPGYPKTWSIFSSCKHLTRISAPVNIIAFAFSRVHGQRKPALFSGKPDTLIAGGNSVNGRCTIAARAIRRKNPKKNRPLSPTSRRSTLATHKELADFLESVETKAFKQACFAVRNEENAQDLVQEAMIRLAEKYGANSVDEFPMLFQRILQNTIRDFYRRTKVRSRWTTLFSSMTADDDEPHDFLETLDLTDEGMAPANPEQLYSQDQLITIIEKELEKLPPRQREAFIMRYWLDLDVAETAAAMGCTDGSVKTHCSRATHTLAKALKQKGITP